MKESNNVESGKNGDAKSLKIMVEMQERQEKVEKKMD